ncbi:MAG: 16S rRNA (uracil(1498)-N(3))-methyltransferase [Lachnospiraceae bacterium]
MYQFFIEDSQILDNCVTIEGTDFNHLKNVIRMKTGEIFRVSVKSGESYLCKLTAIEKDQARGELLSEKSQITELSGKIYLFQGLPKGDKMEWIIQKSVELGVFEIIPVAMNHCVVKLDERKAEAKIARWQTIAESAAKQSKRSRIPRIQEVMNFKEALEYGKNLNVRLVPYENEGGIFSSRQFVQRIKPTDSVGIYIGPEGGFSEGEITQAREQMDSISLGKRILRTETAAIAMLSILMFQMEED